MWCLFNTEVNVLTTLFRKKTSYNGLRDQSGTLNVCLAGGLTAVDRTHAHTPTYLQSHTHWLSGSQWPVHHSEQSFEAHSQAWETTWKIVCACECVWERDRDRGRKQNTVVVAKIYIYNSWLWYGGWEWPNALQMKTTNANRQTEKISSSTWQHTCSINLQQLRKAQQKQKNTAEGFLAM